MADQIYRVNVKANLDAMSSESRFTDVSEGETKIFRFAPSVREDGMIFYMTFNHYKLKSEEGRGIALADLRYHGNEETGTEDYLARLAEVLESSKDQVWKKIGKGISGNKRYYAQGWEGTRVDAAGEAPAFKWSRCKLLALPKTAAEKVLKIMDNQNQMGSPTADDPDRGQAILVSREGTGFNTKYDADRSGVEVALDDIIPGWKDQMFDDVYDAVMLNIYTPTQQKQVAQFTYPELDWQKLESEFGL
jgi:hypothetical protein